MHRQNSGVTVETPTHQCPDRWEARRARLAAVGLNTWGVADGSSYQDWLPGCRTVVVVGSGGPQLWRSFRAAAEADPRLITGHKDPLDRFVRDQVRAIDPHPDASRRWAFGDNSETPSLPSQPLALAAGFGWRSRLWLIIHPVWGPWLGLRAACFTTEALPLTGPQRGASPCEGCPAPCVSACPGSAMAGGNMDWRRCTVHRATSEDCLDRCHSRSACPVGAEHRYPDDAMLWHHDKARGRKAVVAAIGVDDPLAPAGVDWAAMLRRAGERVRGGR